MKSNTDILKKFCRDITESRNNLSAYKIIKNKRQKIVEEAQKEIIDKVKREFSENWRNLEADLASDAHDKRQLDYLVFACLYEEKGDFAEFIKTTIMEVAENFVRDSDKNKYFPVNQDGWNEIVERAEEEGCCCCQEEAEEEAAAAKKKAEEEAAAEIRLP